MALVPLVDLAHLAALLGIEPYDPADADDLAVLRDLLARRSVLAREGGSWLARRHQPSADWGRSGKKRARRAQLGPPSDDR
jgi:hypothetical protein